MGETEQKVAKLEATVEKQEEDIKQLKEVTFGIPQRFDKLEEYFGEFSKDFKNFLNKADYKYQAKEVCDMCRERCKDEVDRRLEDLESDSKWTKRGLIGYTIAIIGFLIKTYVLKV